MILMSRWPCCSDMRWSMRARRRAKDVEAPFGSSSFGLTPSVTFTQPHCAISISQSQRMHRLTWTSTLQSVPLSSRRSMAMS